METHNKHVGARSNESNICKVCSNEKRTYKYTQKHFNSKLHARKFAKFNEKRSVKLVKLLAYET